MSLRWILRSRGKVDATTRGWLRGGNVRSEQLLIIPTELLTNRERLPGELLSGLECPRPGWFLDMKYHTCFPSDSDVHEHPEACDWVSKVEIGWISCRTSLNLVNGGTSLTTILGTRVLAALVGHLVHLWGCVPSSPGETPFTPLPCALLKI